MKKKIVIVFLSIICALCLAIGLSACNSSSGNVDDVPAGEQTDYSTEDEGNGGEETPDDTEQGGTEQDDTTEQGGETTHTHVAGAAVKENEVAATCVTEGSYDSVVYCATCDEEISRETITVPVTEHLYNGGVVTTAATCIEAGVKTYTCIFCDITKTEEIAKMGHTYSGYTYNASSHWQVCTVCGATTEAETHTLSGDKCTVCGYKELKESEGLAYTISEDGLSYSVSGIGTCTDTDLLIPSNYNNLPVTSIGNSAFTNCTSLTSVTIPDSVTSIAAYAFYYCRSLISITISDSVTSIGSYAFSICTSLTSVYYSGTASRWASISFGGYDANPLYYAGDLYINGALATDIIIENIETINAYVFYNCSSLSSIIISDSVTSIGSAAFSGCSSLKSITIPNSVTYIDSVAFRDCTSLTSVTIGSGVTFIGSGAFVYCTSLISVRFEDTNGWYVSTTSGATSGMDVDVTNISDNATYLTSTYLSYNWYKL